ncbi:MAG: abortive infection family protein [Kiritimatiellae bacterium]|nr:abortive infection family protein [Kiritimatiellia bacterium]
MTHRPPLNDAIAFAVARLVDDAQTDRRDPSHSDILFCITQWKLTPGDPNSQGQTVGKLKRVRAVLGWAIEHSHENGRGFVGQLLAMVRTHGGFRADSPNHVGQDAIANLREVMASEGFILTSDGELRPAVLDALEGTELTEALAGYVRRAQKGAEDAALVVGTGKDILEAIAAYVLRECWNNANPPHNFSAALGQAFVALDLKTPADAAANGEPPQHRLQRALYEAACAVNTLRNKQGTGHGRPWLPTVTAEEARHATQVMGVVGDLLLRALRKKKGQ